MTFLVGVLKSASSIKMRIADGEVREWGSGGMGKWGISTKTPTPQNPKTPTPPQNARSDHPKTQPLRN
jgi:hypothetical protein